MKRYRNLLFPSVLAQARATAGMKQVVLALEANVGYSHLCALERGRRVATPGDLVDRVAAALRLPVEARSEMQWSAAHDQLVVAVQSSSLLQAADALVSVSLRAAQALTASQAAGLIGHIDDLIRSAKKLDALEPSASSLPDPEVQAMT